MQPRAARCSTGAGPPGHAPQRRWRSSQLGHRRLCAAGAQAPQPLPPHARGAARRVGKHRLQPASMAHSSCAASAGGAACAGAVRGSQPSTLTHRPGARLPWRPVGPLAGVPCELVARHAVEGLHWMPLSATTRGGSRCHALLRRLVVSDR